MSGCLQLRPKAKAIGTATAKDILDKQRIEAEDYKKNLRIKREESQFPAVRYNVVIGGKAAGPFDIETLQQMAQSNQINGDSLASVLSCIPPSV